jgi:hypothetical protein
MALFPTLRMVFWLGAVPALIAVSGAGPRLVPGRPVMQKPPFSAQVSGRPTFCLRTGSRHTQAAEAAECLPKAVVLASHTASVVCC